MGKEIGLWLAEVVEFSNAPFLAINEPKHIAVNVGVESKWTTSKC